ncbi:MAG TPA: CHAT domain-containing protein, partial [Gammaproteobacteria bacterium]
ESGRIRQASQVQRALGRSTGFAEAFLRGGVANFIGTWWPVSDAAAALCASTLYERLMRGETIGASLQAARSKVLKLGSGDWANYLHYGSLDFTLKRPPES